MAPENLTPEERKIQDAKDDATFKKAIVWALIILIFGVAIYAFVTNSNISCLCFLIACGALGVQSLYIQPKYEDNEPLED